MLASSCTHNAPSFLLYIFLLFQLQFDSPKYIHWVSPYSILGVDFAFILQTLQNFLTHLRWSHSLQYQQPQWWSLTKIPLLIPYIMYRKYIFLIFIVEMLSRPTKILCTAMTTVFSSQTYRKVTQNDMESNGNYYLFFINVSVTRSWSRRMPLIFKTELFCFYCTHRNSFVQLTSLCLLYTRKKTTGQIILNTY